MLKTKRKTNQPHGLVNSTFRIREGRGFGVLTAVGKRFSVLISTNEGRGSGKEGDREETDDQ